MDFAFDYSVAVRDDGLRTGIDLPGPILAAITSCVPLNVHICGPDYHGFEVAKANFDVAFRDGRDANPFVQVTTDVPSSVTLQTHSDSFAEMLTQSGTIHVHVVNPTQFDQSDHFLVYGALWVVAVPEAQTWTLMLVGLALVAAGRNAAASGTT